MAIIGGIIATESYNVEQKNDKDWLKKKALVKQNKF